MKHLLLITFVAMVSFVAKADYSTMTFKTTGGDSHILSVSGLTLAFAQDNLTATNASTTLSLPLAQVESMSFSNDIPDSGINAVNSDKTNEKVTVYDINGVEISASNSVSDVLTNLPKGIYLVRYADGTTLKISKQ